MLAIDVDDDLFDRLALPAILGDTEDTLGCDVSSKSSRRMVSMRMPSCNSPRPATSRNRVGFSLMRGDVALGLANRRRG